MNHPRYNTGSKALHRCVGRVAMLVLLAASAGAMAQATRTSGPTTAPAIAPTTAPVTQLAEGIAFWRETRTHPLNQLHIVTIDLTKADLEIVVLPAGPKDPDGGGPWQTTLQTVRTAARLNRLDVAINGDFFASRDTKELFGHTVRYPVGSPGRVSGRAMTDGVLWSNGRGAGPAAVVVTRDRRVLVGEFDALPADAHQVVSGSVQLVGDGQNVALDDRRHPRTAVGIDREGKMLLFLVVDGRREGHSIGMNLHELADELIALGCWSAVNLDGGGSSTLVARNPHTDLLEVVNVPSDGSTSVEVPLCFERPVANVLGVRVKAKNPQPLPASRP